LNKIHEVNYFKPTCFARDIANTLYGTTDLLAYVFCVMQPLPTCSGAEEKRELSFEVCSFLLLCV